MTDWDEDIYQDPETEYQDFVRALKRKRGFGLYFVLFDRKRREDLITRVKEDLSSKQVEVIHLKETIDNLYARIAKLAEKKNNQIDILFIQGIEYSLYKYELKNFGQMTEKEYYNYTNVPRILNHLNQQREHFRDDFPFSLVFILPSFAVRYFLIRAGDFFDWRSTIFELSKKPEEVETEISRLLSEGCYEEYEKLTQEERTESTLYMLELLSEKDIKNEPTLCLEIGDWLAQNREYQGAVKYYERLLQVKPDDYVAWNNQGNALFNLGEYQSAINSFDKALEIKTDLYQAWNNRGNTLFNLGEYQSAINSFDKALEIKPDYHLAWYNKSRRYALQNNLELALENLHQAININPKYQEMAKTDSDFDSIRHEERFQNLLY